MTRSLIKVQSVVKAFKKVVVVVLVGASRILLLTRIMLVRPRKEA